MKKKNIFFFGISELGYELLKKIINSKKFNILGCLGKKNKKKHSDKFEILLKNLAKKNNIPYLKNLKNTKFKIPKNSFGIIGGYDGILKKDIINKFDIGIFNIHFGIIPYTRGCNPTIWSLLQGNIAGYTLYKVDKEIDLGKIIQLKTIKIKKNDTSYSLYKKLTKLSLSHFDKFLRSLENDNFIYKKINQKKYKNNYFKKFMPNDSYLSWQWKNEFLYDFSRAMYFPNYLPARTRFKNKNIYLYITKFFNDKNSKNSKIMPGEILIKRKNFLKIKTKFGYVFAKTIKNYNILSKKCILESYNNKKFPIYIGKNYTKIKYKNN